MKIVAELSDSASLEELTAAVHDLDANVALLDLGQTRRPQRAGLERRTQPDLPRALLQRIPSLIVVVLESLGRRAIVHSATYVEDVGMNVLFNTIRAATQNVAASGHCSAEGGHG